MCTLNLEMCQLLCIGCFGGSTGSLDLKLGHRGACCSLVHRLQGRHTECISLNKALEGSINLLRVGLYGCTLWFGDQRRVCVGVTCTCMVGRRTLVGCLCQHGSIQLVVLVHRGVNAVNKGRLQYKVQNEGQTSKGCLSTHRTGHVHCNLQPHLDMLGDILDNWAIPGDVLLQEWLHHFLSVAFKLRSQRL